MVHDSSVNSPAGIYYSGLFYGDDYRGSDCSIVSTLYNQPSKLYATTQDTGHEDLITCIAASVTKSI